MPAAKGRRDLSPQTERCGAWVALGGFESVCMREDGHQGECLPLRSECMAEAEWRERVAQAIYDAVAAIDTDGGWPKEGTTDD